MKSPGRVGVRGSSSVKPGVSLQAHLWLDAWPERVTTARSARKDHVRDAGLGTFLGVITGPT
jgi:hypothetical protein